MTETPDPDKIARLLAWLDAWKAAQAAFFGWTKEEYARRREAHETDRRTARDLLAREAARLPFGRNGRLNPVARGHSRAKKTFRDRTDAILEALVARGLERFGARGHWNSMGVYIGHLDPATRRLALLQIKKALDASAEASNA